MLLSLCLISCLKPAEVRQAATPTPVAVAAALESLESGAVSPLPEAVSEVVLSALSERNLPPSLLSIDALGSDWSAVRASEQRLTRLAGAAGGAELLLMLETRAEFYSQLSGQYRWTVDVRATLAPTDDLSAVVVEEFEVPVFLFLYNEREPEAAAAAAPVIERRVSAMLDRYLVP